MSMTTELAQRLEWSAKNGSEIILDSSESQALVEALEARDKQIAQQREYYEGVITDGSKRIAELEAREVRLPDINCFLADDLEDATLAEAFRLLAKGVRAADVAAIRHAGIRIHGAVAQ